MTGARHLQIVPREGRHMLRHFLVVAAAALLWTAWLQASAGAEDDVFQQAVNYVFTGAIDPQDAPEITDRKSCVVVLPDPKWKRFVRYYLARLGLDEPRITSTYS